MSSFFGKGPDSKYLRLVAVHHFCGCYSTLHCSVEAAIGNMGMAVFFTKIGDGWICSWTVLCPTLEASFDYT